MLQTRLCITTSATGEEAAAAGLSEVRTVAVEGPGRDQHARHHWPLIRRNRTTGELDPRISGR